MDDTIQKALRARIDAFATDITALLTDAVAQSVQNALGSSRRGAKASSAKSASRRAVSTDELLRALAKGGDTGLRMEEVARSMAVSTKSLVRPMKALLAAKKVKRSGQARGTKYRGA